MCVLKIIKSCINFSNKTKNILHSCLIFSLPVQVQYGESDQVGVVDAFQYPGGRAGSPRPGHRCSKGTQSGLHNYNDTLPCITAHLFNICHPIQTKNKQFLDRKLCFQCFITGSSIRVSKQSSLTCCSLCRNITRFFFSLHESF